MEIMETRVTTGDEALFSVRNRAISIIIFRGKVGGLSRLTVPELRCPKKQGKPTGIHSWHVVIGMYLRS